jgi:ABC-2 type transport system ATP-binding protein
MLTLTNVVKRYGATIAVDSLSMHIRPGEIFGLLGPNGAGKTTTVGLCCGLLTPDAGTVSIAGAGSPGEPAVRRELGVAPQELALYEELSGDQNLSFFGRLYGLGGTALARRVEAALRFVGLFERRRAAVSTYSGGMKRRLNLAIALIHDPQLLLLDEPTVGVDPQSRNAILENVLELKRQGRTIVYTTHYMEEAQKLCDRVAIIDHGRLAALDTVHTLIEKFGGRTVVVLNGDGREERIETEDPLAVLAQRKAAGALHSFRVEPPDLERVFLNMTGHSLRD